MKENARSTTLVLHFCECVFPDMVIYGIVAHNQNVIMSQSELETMSGINHNIRHQPIQCHAWSRMYVILMIDPRCHFGLLILSNFGRMPQYHKLPYPHSRRKNAMLAYFWYFLS